MPATPVPCLLGPPLVPGKSILIFKQAFDDVCHQVVDSSLVVRVGLGGNTVGYDGANGHAAVSQNFTQSLERSALHLVVGDVSSGILESALVAGICSAGADVVRLGVIPSAAVAHLTRSSKADAGVMVTAAHRSYEINGLKIFSGAGYKISEDVEDELENTVCRHPEIIPLVSHERVGKAIAYKNAEWDYIRHLLKTGRYDFTGIRAVIDCANGCASSTAEKLFSALGVKCIMINDKPDGMNINSRCGVLNTAAMAKMIVERRADIGLVFDGDVGKCLALDEKGEVIDGDQIMARMKTS